MLDIKFIREHKDIVKSAIEKKKVTLDLDELIVLDDKRLEILKEVESLRAEQNEASLSIMGSNAEEKFIIIVEIKIDQNSRISTQISQ